MPDGFSLTCFRKGRCVGIGVKDIKSKEYMSANKRFADLFNYYLFDGEQMISPDDLKEQDPNEVLAVYGSEHTEFLKQKWRDLLKNCVIKSAYGMVLVILGIENQSNIHYAMPVRTMIYDALNYGDQVTEITRKHRNARESGQKEYVTSSEFLSGFRKDDRLIPVITLTLYWGADKWDGPMCLTDMFDGDYGGLKPFMNDYRLHLVAPYSITDFSKFRTELRAVLEFIKASQSEAAMEQVIKKNMMFRHLDIESVETINTFTGVNIPVENTEVNEKGEIDMCKAWEEHKISGMEEQLCSMVSKKLAKGLSAAQIAELFEEDLAVIEKTICQIQRGHS